ncbi:hypothetical protein TWF730_001960 [Orbilia blumenaviensis]|uniref:Uncharacterized protein n=1 Tax=Orbilia blumenaviensis TaxID=1796055 RepID=A0AAV9UCK2_9PEZI
MKLTTITGICLQGLFSQTVLSQTNPQPFAPGSKCLNREVIPTTLIRKLLIRTPDLGNPKSTARRALACKELQGFSREFKGAEDLRVQVEERMRQIMLAKCEDRL